MAHCLPVPAKSSAYALGERLHAPGSPTPTLIASSFRLLIIGNVLLSLRISEQGRSLTIQTFRAVLASLP